VEHETRQTLRAWWAVLWAHAHAGTLPGAPGPGQVATLEHRDGRTAAADSLEPRVVVVPVVDHVSPSNPWPLLDDVRTAEPQAGPAVPWAERAPTPADTGDVA